MQVMNGFHLIVGQLEVEDFEVFFDVVLMRCLRNGNESPLNGPPDGHLSAALVMLLADADQSRVLDQTTLAQWRVAGDSNTLRLAVTDNVVLVVLGLNADLVDCRLDLCCLQQIVDVLPLEVGHSDGSGQLLVDGSLQSLVGAHVIFVRVVHEHQIKIGDVQVLERVVHSLECLLLVGADPTTDLGRDEHVLALDNALGYLFVQSLSHVLLVVVDLGGVDVSVADLECVLDCLHYFVASCLVRAQTDLGHRVVRVELDCRYI